MTNILARLTSFQTSLLIMNDKNINPIGDLLSVGSIIKRILNNLWPGDLFHGIMLPQYLFDHIYYDTFVGFNAYDWGIWEQFYLIFGYWGGIFGLFITMFCVGVLWKALISSTSPFKTFYLTTGIYFLWLMFLNFDVSYVFSSFLIELIVFNIVVRILIAGSMFLTILRVASVWPRRRNAVQ